MNSSIKRKARVHFYAVSAVLVCKLLLLRYLFFDRIAWEWVAADAAPALAIIGLLAAVVPGKAKTAAYWGYNLLFSLIMFASAVYFNHFGSVPTYHALAELNQVFQVKESVESTVLWIDFLFFADFLLLLPALVVLQRRREREYRGRVSEPRFAGRAHLVAVLVFILGGLTLSAYSVRAARDITNELVQAESAGFINYEVAAVLKDRADSDLVGTGDINEVIRETAALQDSYGYRNNPGAAPAYFGSQAGKNIIVIQVEALQNFPLFQKLNGQEITPVLNSLASGGFYFPHVFQQIGPGNTSDAEFMSNTSVYPIGTQAMSTGFGDRVLPSLPRLLRDRGYEAYTFHVNKAGFWNRNELYPALGFNGYYDKPHFQNDEFNAFGASDEQLFLTGAEKLAELKAKGTPFYAQFVTASSHHPFKVPDRFRKITVPDSMQDTMLGDYLAAVNYADYAIGTFVERLKAEGLWEDTVVMIYGDHFGLQPQHVDPEEVHSALGIRYDSRISRFNIPLIIHAPGMPAGKTVERTGGQLDMMPTLANLLGIPLRDSGFNAYGQDLLNIDRNVAGMRYYLPTGSFFNDEILFVPGKGFEDGEAVSIRTLEPVQTIAKYRGDYDYVLKLMGLSDEYVKLLPER